MVQNPATKTAKDFGSKETLNISYGVTCLMVTQENDIIATLEDCYRRWVYGESIDSIKDNNRLSDLISNIDDLYLVESSVTKWFQAHDDFLSAILSGVSHADGKEHFGRRHPQNCRCSLCKEE